MPKQYAEPSRERPGAGPYGRAGRDRKRAGGRAGRDRMRAGGRAGRVRKRADGRAGSIGKFADGEGRDQAMRVAGQSPGQVTFALDRGDYARSPIR